MDLEGGGSVMLFDQFVADCVERLMWDAWFADPDSGLNVLAENRMDLLHEFERRIAEKGIVGLVTLTGVVPGERGTSVFTVRLDVHEIPAINRGDAGTKKTAGEAACKAISLWKEWSPAEGAFSRLENPVWRLADVDEANARIVWALEMTCVTYLETVVQVLGDPATGEVLVSENDESLAVSPTDP